MQITLYIFLDLSFCFPECVSCAAALPLTTHVYLDFVAHSADIKLQNLSAYRGCTALLRIFAFALYICMY